MRQQRPSFRGLGARRGSDSQFSSGEESPPEGSITNVAGGGVRTGPVILHTDLGCGKEGSL